jgi:hypothetical protein
MLGSTVLILEELLFFRCENRTRYSKDVDYSSVFHVVTVAKVAEQRPAMCSQACTLIVANLATLL